MTNGKPLPPRSFKPGASGTSIGAPLGPPKQAVKIEEIVLSLARMKNINVPDIVKKYFRLISPKLVLPKTGYEILNAFSNIDVTSEKVAHFLRCNPYYEYHILRLIESKSLREEMPPLEGVVILLGMQNTRDTILALQMDRLVRNAHATWDKDGKLVLPTNEILKYASRTETLLTGDKSGYSDMGYAAGLLFDLLAMIAADGSKDGKNKLAGFIDSVYSQGLKTAQIGLALTRFVPELSFSKYLFGVCLIHDIGKIVMAILDPDYVAFDEMAVKKGLTRMVRYYAEEQKFGVHHALFGGLVCHDFRMFRAIEKAIFYHHQPFILRKWKLNLFQLSSIVSLASNMANAFRRVDGPNDPILKNWKGPELQDFKLETKLIIAAVNRIVQAGGLKS